MSTPLVRPKRKNPLARTRLPLLPFQMLGWRPPLVSDPPEIGQHNDEVLAEIGYDGEAIARLRSAGMLGPR